MTWADAEAETIACQLRNDNGLRRQSGWMAWIGRHDCRAESDPLGLCCRYREHRQCVWGDAALGCPGRLHALLLGPPDCGYEDRWIGTTKDETCA